MIIFHKSFWQQYNGTKAQDLCTSVVIQVKTCTKHYFRSNGRSWCSDENVQCRFVWGFDAVTGGTNDYIKVFIIGAGPTNIKSGEPNDEYI